MVLDHVNSGGVCAVMQKFKDDMDSLAVLDHSLSDCLDCSLGRIRECWQGKEFIFPNGERAPWKRKTEEELELEAIEAAKAMKREQIKLHLAGKAPKEVKLVFTPEEVDSYLTEGAASWSDDMLRYEIMKYKKNEKAEARKMAISIKSNLMQSVMTKVEAGDALTEGEKLWLNKAENRRNKDSGLHNEKSDFPWCPPLPDVFPTDVFSSELEYDHSRVVAMCQNWLLTGENRFLSNKDDLKFFERTTETERFELCKLTVEFVEKRFKSGVLPHNSGAPNAFNRVHPFLVTQDGTIEFAKHYWSNAWRNDTAVFDKAYVHKEIDWKSETFSVLDKVKPMRVQTVVDGARETLTEYLIHTSCRLHETRVRVQELPNNSKTKRLHPNHLIQEKFHYCSGPFAPASLFHAYGLRTYSWQLPSDLTKRCVLPSLPVSQSTSSPMREVRATIDKDKSAESICLDKGLAVVMDGSSVCHLMTDAFLGQGYHYALPVDVKQILFNGQVMRICTVGHRRVLGAVSHADVTRLAMKCMMKEKFLSTKGKSGEGEQDADNGNAYNYSVWSFGRNSVLVRSTPAPGCKDGPATLRAAEGGGRSYVSIQPKVEYLPHISSMQLDDEEKVWNEMKYSIKGATQHCLARINPCVCRGSKQQYQEAHVLALQPGVPTDWHSTNRAEFNQLLSSRSYRMSCLLDELEKLEEGRYMLVNERNEKLLLLKQISDSAVPDRQESVSLIDCSVAGESITVTSNHPKFEDAFQGFEARVPFQWQVIQKRAPGCFIPKDGKIRYAVEQFAERRKQGRNRGNHRDRRGNAGNQGDRGGRGGRKRGRPRRDRKRQKGRGQGHSEQQGSSSQSQGIVDYSDLSYTPNDQDTHSGRDSDSSASYSDFGISFSPQRNRRYDDDMDCGNLSIAED